MSYNNNNKKKNIRWQLQFFYTFSQLRNLRPVTLYNDMKNTPRI